MGSVGCVVIIGGVGGVLGGLYGGGVGSDEAASTPSDAVELTCDNFPVVVVKSTINSSVAGNNFHFLL